jgi:hypothetical protein
MEADEQTLMWGIEPKDVAIFIGGAVVAVIVGFVFIA